jgi:hypothetical protein
MKKELRIVFRNLITGLVAVAPALSYIIVCVTPYIMAVCVKEVYLERGYWTVGGEYLIPIVMYVIAILLRVGFNKENGQGGVTPPLRMKRFTKKTQTGVTLNPDDLYEAVQYLNEIEEYFDRIGVPYGKQD